MNKILRTKSIIATSVAVVTFLVFLPTLKNEFVNWDDDRYVYENSFIRSLDAKFFKSAFFGFHESNWHPLTWISHALDYALWGLNPLGHHLTNNILHSVNTFLVVLLVVRLLETCGNNPSPPPSPPRGEGSSISPPLRGGDRGEGVSRFTLIAAATTGLLFGLHPLHVESVAWVSERKDLLCALFFLLSIMAYLRYAVRTQSPSPQSPPLKGGAKKEDAQTMGSLQSSPIKNGAVGRVPLPWRERARERGKYYLLSLCFFILALMSKPMAVSLPFVLLILDWYPLRRIQSLKLSRPVFFEKLPFVMLSLISSVLTILAQKAGEAMIPVQLLPLPPRLLVAVKSLFLYLWKMMMPLNLVPLYPYPENISFFSWEYIVPVVLLVGITVACLVVMRKQRLWMSVWTYYVITLVPVLGFVQVGGQSMADRYTYLPSLGPFLIIGLIAAEVYERVTALKRWGVVLRIAGLFFASVVFASMSYATIEQIGIWKNSIIFWEYVASKEALVAPAAHINLGNAYLSEGLSDRAIEQYQTALRLRPDYAEAHFNLGNAYSSLGLSDRAIEQYQTALRLKPGYAEAYFGLGNTYLSEGRFDMAIEQYKAALRLNPDYAEARFNLGNAYLSEGLFDMAIEQYRAVLSLWPDYAEAHFNLGRIYLNNGQKDMARREFESGLRTKPDDYKAREVLRSINTR